MSEAQQPDSRELVIADGYPEPNNIELLEQSAHQLGEKLLEQERDEVALRRRLVLLGEPIANGANRLLGTKLTFGRGTPQFGGTRRFRWQASDARQHKTYKVGLVHRNENLEALIVEGFKHGPDPKRKFKLGLHFDPVTQDILDKLGIPQDEYNAAHALNKLVLECNNENLQEVLDWKSNPYFFIHLAKISHGNFGRDFNSHDYRKNHPYSGRLKLTTDLLDPSIEMLLKQPKKDYVYDGVIPGLSLASISSLGPLTLNNFNPDHFILPPQEFPWSVLSILFLSMQAGLGTHRVVKEVRRNGRIFQSKFGYDPSNKDLRPTELTHYTKTKGYQTDRQPIDLEDYFGSISELISLVPTK